MIRYPNVLALCELSVQHRHQTLLTLLQMKCYMFTMQELASGGGGGGGAFHTFKKLFYTTEAMMNYGSNHSIVFVLLQIRLALLILQNGQDTYSNPLVDLFPEFQIDAQAEYQTLVWPNSPVVPWRAGTCLECWPRRDMNEFVIPSRDVCVIAIVSNLRSNQFQTATGSTDVLATLNDETKSDDSASSVFGMPNPVDYQRTKRVMGRAEEGDHRAMLEHERCLWLLLMYARPCSQHFTAEDMTSLCQMRYVSEDGARYTKDVIVAKLVYRISDRGCCVRWTTTRTHPSFSRMYLRQS